MKRLELRKELMATIDKGYSHFTFDQIIAEVEMAVVQVATEKKWATPNTRQPWTDSELALVLRDAPTKLNTLKYARLLGRGYGSVEQVYRWAATSDKEIKAKRSKDKFVAQIKRVAKRLGWRA